METIDGAFSKAFYAYNTIMLKGELNIDNLLKSIEEISTNVGCKSIVSTKNKALLIIIENDQTQKQYSMLHESPVDLKMFIQEVAIAIYKICNGEEISDDLLLYEIKLKLKPKYFILKQGNELQHKVGIIRAITGYEAILAAESITFHSTIKTTYKSETEIIGIAATLKGAESIGNKYIIKNERGVRL